MPSPLEVLGLAPGPSRPEGGAVARTFTFDAPAMDPAAWAAFGEHLSVSAEHLRNWARVSAKGSVRDVEAVVTGIAATVAAAPPGAVPAMRVRLTAADELFVREVLRRGLQRAVNEIPDVPHQWRTEAAKRGMSSLLLAWDLLIDFSDPQTGYRPRRPGHGSGCWPRVTRRAR